MEMHQIRYFLSVSETLNFTRAAERCNVSQPALTRAIQALEDALGGPLFRRERNHTHLTELGNLMLPYLRQTYEAVHAARQEAEQFRKLEKAPVRFGVMCTIGPTRMIDFFGRLKADVPKLDLSLIEARGSELIRRMMEGELDIALIGMPKLPERFDARPLYAERYVVAFAAGHPFETLDVVPARLLDGERYLQRINCEFPDHFAETGLEKPYQVNVVYKSEREDWIQALVQAGMGIAVMPEFMPQLPGIVTRPLVEPALVREVKLVTVAGRQFSPVMLKLVRLAATYRWDVASRAATVANAATTSPASKGAAKSASTRAQRTIPLASTT